VSASNTSISRVENSVGPRWLSYWLALLPALYVISPLALLALPQLRRLPKHIWWLLGGYALSQQLPALLTPEPLLASLLALGRTLLLFGLIGVGAALSEASRLRPAAIGLFVVYLTAVIYSLAGGTDFLVGRLTHPYMTAITVGLSGAFGVWLSLFGRGRRVWRVPLGVLAVLVLVLAGSRGPLAATVVGCVVGAAAQGNRRVVLALVAGGVLVSGGLFLGDRAGLDSVRRLGSADTTGRDIVWSTALGVIQNEPWGGVGSYRLGQYLAPSGDGCTLFLTADGQQPSCPAWIKRLGNPWLIAHNVTLQQLAETGPLGLLGLLTLLTAVVVACIQRRDPLACAVVAGLVLSTVTDNTLLVPSPFFAEFFWVLAGTQLTGLRQVPWWSGVTGSVLALGLSAPLLAASFDRSRAPVQVPPRLTFLSAPDTTRQGQPYMVAARFDIPAGGYRVTLASCTRICTPLVTVPLQIDSGADMTPLSLLTVRLPAVAYQRVELRLLPGQSSFNLQSLGVRSWTVKLDH
jgi:O-antigen ligase